MLRAVVTNDVHMNESFINEVIYLSGYNGLKNDFNAIST